MRAQSDEVDQNLGVVTGRGGAAARALAYRRGELGSIPGGAALGLSHAGIVLLHFEASPYSTRFALIGSRLPGGSVAGGRCLSSSGHWNEETTEDGCVRASTSAIIISLQNHEKGGVGSALAKRLARSPPTKAVQSPAGSPNFRKWESCRTMPLVDGFSRGFPVSPSPSFRRRSIFTSITLIGSQDLAAMAHFIRVAVSPLLLDLKRGEDPFTLHCCWRLAKRTLAAHNNCEENFQLHLGRARSAVVDQPCPEADQVHLSPTLPYKVGNIATHLRGHGARTVSLLASHQGDPGSIPGLVTPDFCMWESCRTMSLVGGFSRGYPVSPALSFATSITLIGSQDLDVKSRPSCFTHAFDSFLSSCRNVVCITAYRLSLAEIAENSFLESYVHEFSNSSCVNGKFSYQVENTGKNRNGFNLELTSIFHTEGENCANPDPFSCWLGCQQMGRLQDIGLRTVFANTQAGNFTRPQCDENIARRFKALLLAAMACLIRAGVSPLSLPRFEVSNAGKSSQVAASLGIEVTRADEGETRSPRKPADQLHHAARFPTMRRSGNRTRFALVWAPIGVRKLDGFSFHKTFENLTGSRIYLMFDGIGQSESCTAKMDVKKRTITNNFWKRSIQKRVGSPRAVLLFSRAVPIRVRHSSTSRVPPVAALLKRPEIIGSPTPLKSELMASERNWGRGDARAVKYLKSGSAELLDEALFKEQ
ncbi:hypothetical protein PR048_031462 [Dryococelus australis]|uniref:Uncharacterized protein n=1 Tax=Dryococelus australis TaxID=614101 RepID=A0ABQ9G9D7_9NEOP|nr:hypothetical protein PR048_031462 [Dryococelus australis]